MLYLQKLLASCGLFLYLLPTISNAEIYTGGLHFMRSPALIIEEQNVSLGLNQISAEYLIQNDSNIDIIETMVTPIPMSVTIDDQSIDYKTTNRAITYNGQDISNILKSLGIPYDPITAMHSIDASPNRDSIRAKLINLKIIDKKDETPEWFAKNFYYWQQKFPAHSKIKITQSYKPNLTTKSIKIKGNTNILNVPINVLKKLYNLTVNWTLEDQISAQNLQAILEKNNPQIKDFCPSLKDYQIIIGPQNKLDNKKSDVESKELNYHYLADDLWSTPIKHFTLNLSSTNLSRL